MLLGDYGASVLRIDGPRSPKGDVLARNKASVSIDLKQDESRQALLSIISEADVLIDPFRPGVLERLKLSPTDVLLKRNTRLIVARLTGFRRDGKYRNLAGHDINYLAVGGVLSMLGRASETPHPPANILGDFAGGGMMCTLGILLALMSRQATGVGQVVDVNMVDGAAYLATMPRLSTKTPFWGDQRGRNYLDGGCPWYTTYETKIEGQYVAVGALEPRFYEALVQGLGLTMRDLPSRDDKTNWPALENIFRNTFVQKSREEWEQVFDGVDACVTPVLSQSELEKTGYEQRLPAQLRASPGKDIPAGHGDWSGGKIDKGHRGQEILRAWIGWREGTHYRERADGIIEMISHAKL